MIDNISIGDISIDCTNQERTRDFYSVLTGWEKCEAYGCPALVGEGGLLILFMVCDFEYISPVWPEEEGKQQKQMQMHFHFRVDDLLSAVEEAIKLGATKAAVFNKIGISAGFSTDKRACCRIFILQHALPDLLIIKRIFAQV
jgi:hypothetical protein